MPGPYADVMRCRVALMLPGLIGSCRGSSDGDAMHDAHPRVVLIMQFGFSWRRTSAACMR